MSAKVLPLPALPLPPPSVRGAPHALCTPTLRPDCPFLLPPLPLVGLSIHLPALPALLYHRSIRVILHDHPSKPTPTQITQRRQKHKNMTQNTETPSSVYGGN